MSHDCDDDQDDNQDMPAIDRSPWMICPTCSGEGKHSRALGSFSMEEFHEAFDVDECEAYMNGAYDQRCETCHGAGKVREKAWADWCERREDRRTQLREDGIYDRDFY